MAVSVSTIQAKYRRAMDEAGTLGTLLLHNGTNSWASHPDIRMTLGRMMPHELVAPVEQYHLKLIMLGEDLPDGLTKLKTRDRVKIDGREYTVVKGDFGVRQVKGVVIAVEAAVKG
jgi:hypothetical protein